MLFVSCPMFWLRILACSWKQRVSLTPCYHLMAQIRDLSVTGPEVSFSPLLWACCIYRLKITVLVLSSVVSTEKSKIQIMLRDWHHGLWNSLNQHSNQRNEIPQIDHQNATRVSTQSTAACLKVGGQVSLPNWTMLLSLKY